MKFFHMDIINSCPNT